MKTTLKQLLLWPPTPTTVFAIACGVALGVFELAGGTANTAQSIPAAIAVLGVLHYLVPDSTGQIEKVENAVTELEKTSCPR